VCVSGLALQPVAWQVAVWICTPEGCVGFRVAAADSGHHACTYTPAQQLVILRGSLCCAVLCMGTVCESNWQLSTGLVPYVHSTAIVLSSWYQKKPVARCAVLCWVVGRWGVLRM
jgi:hypothetical protein